MFNTKPVPPGKEYVQVGNGVFLRVQCVGTINLVFHTQNSTGEIGFRVQMSEVYLVPGISFNLLSLHHAQRKQGILLDYRGAHLFDGQQCFAYFNVGCSLLATRLPLGCADGAVAYGHGAPPSPPPQGMPQPDVG
ncbi:unnamed protein product, partial [Pylaiella littoralis]